MSLKVYNGIKFRSKKMHEIIRGLYDLKEQAVENSKQYTLENPDHAIYAMLGDRSVDDIFKEDFDFEPWRDADKVRENLRKDLRKCTDPNFLFSVTLIPWSDGNVYGIYYADRILANERLLLDTLADDFHYQNQTDKPDDIPTREWKKRGKIWNAIFDDYFYNSDAGPLYEIVKPDDFNHELMEKAFKNFKELFTEGYEIYVEINSREELKKRKADIVDKIEELGDVLVHNLSWFSSCPCMHVRSLNCAAIEKAEEILLKHTDILTFKGIEETHLRKKWFTDEHKKAIKELSDD